MSRSKVITTRVDQETLDLIDKVAQAQGRSRADFVARVLAQVVEAEAEFITFVQEGVDAADRGELVPHQQVAKEIGEMIKDHQTKLVSGRDEAA